MSTLRKSKGLVADVGDVLQRPGLEVVDADHPMALPEQVLTEMGAEEAGPAGDDACAHRGEGYRQDEPATIREMR